MKKNEIVILGMNGSIGQLFIQNPRVCAANFRLENDVGEMVSGLRATGASYIINSAAITDIKTCEADPDYAAQINVTGACNLFKAASAAGYKRFIQISTSHVYGTSTYFKRFGVCDDCDPKSTYGETKLEAERQLKKFSKEYKIALSIIRIFSVLSPTLRQGYLLPNLVARAKSRDYSAINGLNSVRDFVYANEIERCLLKEASKHIPSRIFNLCSGKGTPLRDVVKMVYKKYGADYNSIENFHDFESAGDFLVGDPSKDSLIKIDI